MTKPDVSIVVCTYNRADMLGNALESLNKLVTDASFTYEVIVVDNASSDNTCVVADAAAAQYHQGRLRCVTEERQGVAFARNRGIQEARGEWIAFFDDDQLANPQWIHRLRQLAERRGALCVGGAVHLKLPAGNNRPLAPLCRMLLGEAVVDVEKRYDPKFTPGTGNLMIHRTVFSQIGLFDESLNQRGEDTDLFLRMHAAGIEAWYSPLAVVHHVITNERLDDHYLISLSNIMVDGLAEIDRNKWGDLLFPLVVAARIGATTFWSVPRLAMWDWFVSHRKSMLSTRCRLAITGGYVRQALPLIIPRRNAPTSPGATATVKVYATER